MIIQILLIMSLVIFTLVVITRLYTMAIFQVFFNQFWLDHTDVRKVTLSVELDGDGIFELFFRDDEGVDRSIKRLKHIDSESISLNIDLLGPKCYGRYYFKVSSNIIIKNVEWSSAEKPVREVKLALCICTYKKEEYLKNTISKLKPILSDNIQVYITDNGKSVDINEDFVHIKSQKNLGGAGGFTRSLMDSSKNEEITHFLIMDDDIEIDPINIKKLISYHSYTKKDIPISGSMLNLRSRNQLCEAGANCDFLGSKSFFSNLDISEPANLDKIASPYHFEYGAWWFFSLSRNLFSEVGLPMPLFIRGDDKEYGLRLRKYGHKSVHPPGLGVWHEPFSEKLSLWLKFYDVRNFLILNSLPHSKFEHHLLVLLKIQLLLIYYLLKGKGKYAAMLTESLRDYRHGAISINGCSDKKHKYVMKTANDLNSLQRINRFQSFRILVEGTLEVLLSVHLQKEICADYNSSFKKFTSKEYWSEIFGSAS